MLDSIPTEHRSIQVFRMASYQDDTELLAPSARCEGTTLPVFERSALSNARDLETVALT